MASKSTSGAETSGKLGAPRGAAFSSAECTRITRAMIQAKNDRIHGSGQKRDEYHLNFLAYFTKIKDDVWPDRTLSSLIGNNSSDNLSLMLSAPPQACLSSVTVATYVCSFLTGKYTDIKRDCTKFSSCLSVVKAIPNKSGSTSKHVYPQPQAKI